MVIVVVMMVVMVVITGYFIGNDKSGHLVTYSQLISSLLNLPQFTSRFATHRPLTHPINQSLNHSQVEANSECVFGARPERDAQKRKALEAARTTHLRALQVTHLPPLLFLAINLS